MRRTSRVALIVKTLSDNPGRLYKLSWFCEKYGAAKSTISEDIRLAKEAVEEMGEGKIVTVPGANGGVLYDSYITDAECTALQEELCEELRDPSRIMGGGFMYISDIFFNPKWTKNMARMMARRFQNVPADFVATIETRGIPLAMMTAMHLGLPLAVVRRSSKISEGATISINYFSGSAERMQKISLAQRAVTRGGNAIIIDDYMRGGGSLRGISELLSEFDVTVSGIGVALATTEPEIKKIQQYTALLYLHDIHEDSGIVEVSPNDRVFEELPG